ncbi:MAG: hypothetical protein U0794_08555 [Isosphaeraceae bacterium]
MSQVTRGSLGSASPIGRESAPHDLDEDVPTVSGIASPELRRALAEVKGQAQFLLYLADQIEESLDQLAQETDSCHGSFLCRILSMYSTQLESKHQGLGDKIAETCQELYVTVREFDAV